MKAYITKYALTRGIMEVEGEQSKTNSSCFICNDEIIDHGGKYFYDNDWHLKLEVAQLTAYAIVKDKIASLEKQIEKLKNKTF